MNLFKENRTLFYLIIIYFLYLIFSLPSLYKPLVADDTTFARDAENPQFGLLGVWHPPLYFDILRFLVHHLGIKRENLRFFGILCFLLNLILIYLISKKVSLDKRVGILACFLFASHHWAIQGSLILDIDNTILTVLLTFFIFYFIKNHSLFRLKHYLFSGLLFFLCLWAKLSTPLILLFSVLLFYILKGEIRKGIAYTSITGAIGIGLFFLFWAIYSQFYNLAFLSVFERSLAVLNRGPAGPTLPAFTEIILRLIRIPLWIGLYLCLLWLIIFILRIKDYFIHKKTIEIKDFFLIYTILIFISYILIGGVSYSFAKYQYPLLSILSILIADFIFGLKSKISKLQVILFIFLGISFIAIENLYIGNLIYRINYLLRKLAIFTPEEINNFFFAFGWRIISYFLILTIGIFLIRILTKKENILKVSVTLLYVLILITNFSYNFRHLKADYFTTYCYGRSIKDYKQLEVLFKGILSQKKDALIIGPEDTLLNAGLKGYSVYNYSLLWNDRQGFLRAIKDKRVSCVSYGFTWNTLFTYREIFFNPEVKKTLEEEYNLIPIGEYSIWLRK